MDPELNVLFGALALQADLIDASQLAEACRAWRAQQEVPLADLLRARGWITPAELAELERQVQRKLHKHGHSVQASLAAVANPELRRTLDMLNDPELQEVLTVLSQGEALEAASIAPYVPLTRERYHLLHVHAMGGLGRVWLARDEHLGREVALKELRTDRVHDTAQKAWFLKEARITGQLEHPGIVPVYELARRPGEEQPFYTMRFIKGRTLAEAVSAYHQKRQAGSADPLDFRTLLQAFVAVCQALAYAHARGVIHRDLKGQNVIVGDFGEVIVLDWGLAKVLHLPQEEEATNSVVVDQEGTVEPTAQGQILGTPAYMAPEQAAGRPDLIDRRTDVYGLGAILYHLLTDQPPFTGTATHEVLLKVQKAEPVRPRQRWPRVPPALEAICLRALAKKPEQRYASAGELAHDVQRWLADEPVTAYREPLRTRLSRWARRHKALVTGAAALLVTAVIALTISTVLIGRARAREAEQRTEAQANFRLARQAVDRYHSLVSQSRLLHEPGLQPLRRELLQSALEFYAGFVAKRPDDPGLQADLAGAYFHLAAITAEIASKPRARELFQQAQAILEKLVNEHPEDTDYPSELAQCFSNLGVLALELGNPAEAATAYRKALALFERLARDHPGDPAAARDLALCYNNLGRLYHDTHQTEQAETFHQKALEIRTHLVQDHPTVPAYREDLAISHLNLGTLSRERGAAERAETAYRSALAVSEQLARAHPKVASYQSALAACWNNLGDLYQDTQRLDLAEQAYQAALRLREQLVRNHPLVLVYQRELAKSHLNLGTLSHERGLWAEAIAAHEKALALYEDVVNEDPTVAEYQDELASTYTNLGLLARLARDFARAEAAYGEALLIWQRLTQEHADQPDYANQLAWSHYNLGHVHRARGQQPLAVASYQQALAVWDQQVPNHPLERGTGQSREAVYLARALARARVGDYRQAPAEAQALSKGAALSASTLHALAQIYSLCLEAVLADASLSPAERAGRLQDYTAGALQLAHLADRLGYLKDAAVFDQLKNDPDLAALWTREEFKKLLNELESRSKGKTN